MRPRFRCRVRTLIVTIAGLSLVFAYVGSYHRLSRRGLREASVYGSPAFFYVPWEEAIASRDLSRHYRLAAFYAPVNWVDRTLLGGPYPWRGESGV